VLRCTARSLYVGVSSTLSTALRMSATAGGHGLLRRLRRYVAELGSRRAVGHARRLCPDRDGRHEAMGSRGRRDGCAAAVPYVRTLRPAYALFPGNGKTRLRAPTSSPAHR
jgi:hypothetical protein